MFNREVDTDKTIDRAKVNKHLENNLLYRRLESDLDELS